MRRLPLAAAATVLGALAATGCSSSTAAAGPAHGGGVPRLRVVRGYVPQPPLSDMAAGYFTVLNTGSAADRLTSVSSAAASDISLMATSSDGSMHGVAGLPIPAGGQLRLRVGGDHLMLMGLKAKPVAGGHVTFELHFARSAPVTVRVPVEPAAYRPRG